VIAAGGLRYQHNPITPISSLLPIAEQRRLLVVDRVNTQISGLSIDCSACPLSVVIHSLLLVLKSGIHCLAICTIQLWARPVSTKSENPPVCLLSAFVDSALEVYFTYSLYTN